MLYLKISVENGIISLHPLNPDEMYYKCEAEIEEDYELEQEKEFQSRIEKVLKMNNLIK
jgi:hypothetical protein